MCMYECMHQSRVCVLCFCLCFCAFLYVFVCVYVYVYVCLCEVSCHERDLVCCVYVVCIVCFECVVGFTRVCSVVCVRFCFARAGFIFLFSNPSLRVCIHICVSANMCL